MFTNNLLWLIYEPLVAKGLNAKRRGDCSEKYAYFILSVGYSAFLVATWLSYFL
jgi:hypothetical protein